MSLITLHIHIHYHPSINHSFISETMSIDEGEAKPTLVFLGRDLLKIPCFRNTFLYSISSWVGVGLVTFLFTSRPQFSSHVGCGAFIAVSLGYYMQCRMNYENQKFQMSQIKHAMQRAVAMEGVEPDNDDKSPKLGEA